ncbi:MAG: GNAT family N-acetyltransferase, partial [Muribaculaceae bacterium]
MKIRLGIYSPTQHSEWNHFVYGAKNSTFMHLREYMDYHSQRFSDCSIVAYQDNKIIGVMPANRVGDTLYSHQGLTYAGWLVPTKHFDVVNMLAIWDAMAEFLPTIGIKRLVYKPSPHIYHSYPAEEDLYAIFRHNGVITASNISSAIPVADAIRFNENSRRQVRLAQNEGVTVEETSDYEAYWNVLTELLDERYGVKPVHTLAEINLLHSLFPINIRLFTACLGGEVLGGVLIYHTGHVAHAQYIAASKRGKKMKVLPMIFDHLINNEFSQTRYFDFGISNEQGGRVLNEGLAMQKSGMGGRGIVYNTY